MRETGQQSIRGIPYLNSRFPNLGIESLALSDLFKRVSVDHFDHPQRPAFHLLILFSSGATDHYLDFERLRCTAGTLLHVRPRQVQQFLPFRDAEAAMLLFAAEFVLPEADAINPLVSGSALDHAAPTGLINLNPDAYARVNSGFIALQEEYKRTDGSLVCTRIMQHLLQALLLQIASCSKPPESVSIPKYQPIIRRFLADLESKFTKTRRVDDYVCKLGCSAKTLRRACIANRGIPPKTIIEQRVILEAKRLIAHTFIPIEQIGVTLGFDEPTNFTKFFHQHAQMTPSQFRLQFPGRTPRAVRSV